MRGESELYAGTSWLREQHVQDSGTSAPNVGREGRPTVDTAEEQEEQHSQGGDFCKYSFVFSLILGTLDQGTSHSLGVMRKLCREFLFHPCE